MKDWTLNPEPEPTCSLCGRKKGKHKAKTFNCVSGRGKAAWFKHNQFFKAKKKKGDRDE